jgi:hypothetical protein
LTEAAMGRLLESTKWSSIFNLPSLINPVEEEEKETFLYGSFSFQAKFDDLLAHDGSIRCLILKNKKVIKRSLLIFLIMNSRVLYSHAEFYRD